MRRHERIQNNESIQSITKVNRSQGTSPHRARQSQGSICVMANLFAVAVIWCLLTSHPPTEWALSSQLKGQQGTKHILYYTTYWHLPDFQFGEGRDPFLKTKCPINDCIITSNRSLLANISDFDAFVFHAHHDPVSFHDYHEIQTIRKPNHRFVLLALESPLYTSRRIPSRSSRQQLPLLEDTIDAFGNVVVNDPYDDFFHWIMSYRWDSDIPRPYGWFQELGSEEFLPSLPEKWKSYSPEKFKASLSSKPDSFRQKARRPKKIGWVVSNCITPSNRSAYVEELSKYIDVDIFGACGTQICSGKYGEDNGQDTCSAQVQSDYKFYLAFENSYCNDYITEKFFGRIQHNVVIVMGQGNYSRLAPPHSYISVHDYESPRELAKYLHKLDRDEEEYLSYFWWQDYYRVVPQEWGEEQRRLYLGRNWCQLCAKLHENEANVPTYSDLQGWWNKPAECNRLDWGGVNKKMHLDWNL